MKVYTKIVMDVNGNVLEEESYDYHGPVAQCGGGGTTVQTTTLPPPTKEQTETEKLNLDLLRRQMSQMTQSAALSNPEQAMAYLDLPAEKRSATSPFAGLEAMDSPTLRADLTRALTDKTQNQQTLDLLNRRMTEQITGTARLTPEETALLDETFSSAQRTGERDIDRFVRETAAMRGLNISDSPIAGELARSTGDFNLGLKSARAQASLNLGESSKIFNESVREFQQGLAQQAFVNRMNLSSQAPMISAPLMSNFASQRMAQGTTTQKKNPGLFDWIQMGAGAVESLGKGIGYVGMCWIAIAVYGPTSPEVAIIRPWLTAWEQRSVIGKIVIAAYRRWGKQIARFITKYPRFQFVFKPLFERVLHLAQV